VLGNCGDFQLRNSGVSIPLIPRVSSGISLASSDIDCTLIVLEDRLLLNSSGRSG
jgi:hypothetical protein